MAKFRKVNYLFSSEMTTNFLFLLERRLQTLIWRLFVLKTGKLPGVRNLILGGFLKVDNLVIKNPSFLVKQESFVRFIKEPPRLWDRTSFRHLGLLKNFIDKSRGL
jgi:ribosomal protein S4